MSATASALATTASNTFEHLQAIAEALISPSESQRQAGVNELNSLYTKPKANLIEPILTAISVSTNDQVFVLACNIAERVWVGEGEYEMYMVQDYSKLLETSFARLTNKERPPSSIGMRKLLYLYANLLKYSWQDDRVKQTMECLISLLSSPPDLCSIGLRILRVILQEFSFKRVSETMTTNRKLVISLKQHGLTAIFQSAFLLLCRLAKGETSIDDTRLRFRLTKDALGLVDECLIFTDYLHSTRNDNTTAMIPEDWVDMLFPPTDNTLAIRLFTDIYLQLCSFPKHANIVLSILISLVSISKACFTSDDVFVQQRRAAVRSVICVCGALGERTLGNLHSVCRYIRAMKSMVSMKIMMEDEGVGGVVAGGESWNASGKNTNTATTTITTRTRSGGSVVTVVGQGMMGVMGMGGEEAGGTEMEADGGGGNVMNNMNNMNNLNNQAPPLWLSAIRAIRELTSQVIQLSVAGSSLIEQDDVRECLSLLLFFWYTFSTGLTCVPSVLEAKIQQAARECGEVWKEIVGSLLDTVSIHNDLAGHEHYGDEYSNCCSGGGVGLGMGGMSGYSSPSPSAPVSSYAVSSPSSLALSSLSSLSSMGDPDQSNVCLGNITISARDITSIGILAKSIPPDESTPLLAAAFDNEIATLKGLYGSLVSNINNINNILPNLIRTELKCATLVYVSTWVMRNRTSFASGESDANIMSRVFTIAHFLMTLMNTTDKSASVVSGSASSPAQSQSQPHCQSLVSVDGRCARGSLRILLGSLLYSFKYFCSSHIRNGKPSKDLVSILLPFMLSMDGGCDTSNFNNMSNININSSSTPTSSASNPRASINVNTSSGRAEEYSDLVRCFIFKASEFLINFVLLLLNLLPSEGKTVLYRAMELLIDMSNSSTTISVPSSGSYYGGTGMSVGIGGMAMPIGSGVSAGVGVGVNSSGVSTQSGIPIPVQSHPPTTMNELIATIPAIIALFRKNPLDTFPSPTEAMPSDVISGILKSSVGFYSFLIQTCWAVGRERQVAYYYKSVDMVLKGIEKEMESLALSLPPALGMGMGIGMGSISGGVNSSSGLAGSSGSPNSGDDANTINSIARVANYLATPAKQLLIARVLRLLEGSEVLFVKPRLQIDGIFLIPHNMLLSTIAIGCGFVGLPLIHEPLLKFFHQLTQTRRDRFNNSNSYNARPLSLLVLRTVCNGMSAFLNGLLLRVKREGGVAGASVSAGGENNYFYINTVKPLSIISRIVTRILQSWEPPFNIISLYNDATFHNLFKFYLINVSLVPIKAIIFKPNHAKAITRCVEIVITTIPTIYGQLDIDSIKRLWELMTLMLNMQVQQDEIINNILRCIESIIKYINQCEITANVINSNNSEELFLHMMSEDAIPVEDIVYGRNIKESIMASSITPMAILDKLIDALVYEEHSQPLGFILPVPALILFCGKENFMNRMVARMSQGKSAENVNNICTVIRESFGGIDFEMTDRCKSVVSHALETVKRNLQSSTN